MSKQKPSLPRGTRDFAPEVAAKRNYIIEVIKKNFKRYGFNQLETPALENLSTLTGKYGDEGDQLLFKVLNSGDYLSKATAEDMDKGSKHLTSKIAEKGLRYDLTVPFARFVVMNRNNITFPFKRFQVQPVWRADRPQKGRYREFYQCDADIIGTRSSWNEVELTLLIMDVFRDLGLKDFSLKVNHRELLFLLAKVAGLEARTVAFCAEIDKIDKIGIERVEENILQLGADPGQLKAVLAILQKNEYSDILASVAELEADNPGLNELTQFFETLKTLDVGLDKVELDISLARGLSYYTGMIYEVKPTSVKMGSILGGGRYDNLTGVFGLEGVSGIGISFGLDRIYDVLEELRLFPDTITRQVDVLIAHFGTENLSEGMKLVVALRKEGIAAELYPDAVKIQKQFTYADRLQVPYVLIIGDEERKTARYQLKNMATGEQQALSLNEVVNNISDK